MVKYQIVSHKVQKKNGGFKSKNLSHNFLKELNTGSIKNGARLYEPHLRKIKINSVLDKKKKICVKTSTFEPHASFFK